MKKLVVGVLAHVDAGKTTLSEAMLYRGGALRKLGRVDHQDAFLDTDTLERERGITIFSKQAVLPLPEGTIQLLDTPGHVDFAAEAERTMPVLDCAVLVVSGTDGVQGHTRTLWRLLERYHVPTFVFVNKMDLPGAEKDALLRELKSRLGDGCVDFSAPRDDGFYEAAALCGEEALSEYLERGAVEEETLSALIARRALFPCWFGSALRLSGVDGLLDGLVRLAPRRAYPEEFGARIYKITRDGQGARLTHLKVTGGTLRVKDILSNRREEGSSETVWEEKADQIRVYSGTKFTAVQEAPAGTVCAVTGLSRTRAGQGLGFEDAGAEAALEPVLTCRVFPAEGGDPHAVLEALRLLEEEDPQLHVVWNETLREIHLHLMGAVQLEILRRVLKDRFSLSADFGPGSIVYRETIAAPAAGVGHFEPLRHYAEVHLLLEPGERGSGVRYGSACLEDVLDRSWQRLILAMLAHPPVPGVLTGAPLTDVKITLTAGRAHEKHTEGGDFRQAARRAVRQALMGARNVLLEPWYEFRLEVPTENLGRAMTDLQRMNAEAGPPETRGEESVLAGGAPVSALRDYAAEVTSYTRGRGRLFCTLSGYRPCPEQSAVVSALGYEAERDVENPADSVFCAHGAGYLVRWDEVPAHAHVQSPLRLRRDGEERPAPDVRPAAPRAAYAGTFEQDKELQAIFERTYGPVKRRDFIPRPEPPQSAPERAVPDRAAEEEYLLVDGYNIIFAWDELKSVAAENLDAARRLLMDILCNYQGLRRCRVILVFDAYKVPGYEGETMPYHNITVVYTREAETADAYIEKATYQLREERRVRVATSDNAEQLIILCHGALRLSAAAFHEEVLRTRVQMGEILRRNNRPGDSRAVGAALERAERKAREQ